MDEKAKKQADATRRYQKFIEKQSGKAVRPLLPQKPFRDDGFVNFANKYGTAQDTTENYTFQREEDVMDEELITFYEGNGLFAKIIDAPAEEAIKHGFVLGDVKDQAVQDFCYESLDELDWEETAMTALKWSRLFGGSIVVMLINDGRGIDEPLDWSNIQSIDDLRVYDRSLIQPDTTSMFTYERDDPFRTRASRLGTPERYHVYSKYGNFTVHESRCLIFPNGILPENTTHSTYEFWGMPEYIRIRRAIRDTELAHSNAGKMLDRSVQAVYKMKDLAQLLATEEGEDLAVKRMQTVDLARGLLSTILLDAEGEDYDFKQFQFGGVSEVIDTACNFLSALTSIPQTILFGRSPAGMNSTGTSDLENWYSYVERIQKRTVRNNLRYLLSIIFQAGVATGEIDEVPKIKVEFNPLWSLSEAEQSDLELKKAQIQQTKASTAQIYVDMQVIDPTEVRKKLADSQEFDVENMLDEYDPGGDDLFPEEPDEDDPDEGNSPDAAPAATKLPQDMTDEELAHKALEGVNNEDDEGGTYTSLEQKNPLSVGVIVISEGKVLCGTRMHGTGRGLICGPGGHIEDGETPEQAAFRETEEEFGISPKELIPIGYGPKEVTSGLTPCLFLCTEYNGKPYAASDEIKDPEFISLEELELLSPSLFQPFKDGVEKVVASLDDETLEDGGPGSGNFGHEGVPGQIGGSAPQNGSVLSNRKKPNVQKAEEFDSYISSHHLAPIYRGFSAPSDKEESQRFSDIKQGKVPVSRSSNSALGTGVYFCNSKSEAESYMYRRQGETGEKCGKVATAALDVGARTIEHSDLIEKKMSRESSERSKLFSMMKEKETDSDEFRKAESEYKKLERMSISDYAVSEGYDAITDSGTGYTVVVNQNALVVRDDGKELTFPFISENPIDKSTFSSIIKSKETTEDGAPEGNDNAKGPHKRSKLSQADKDAYNKRIIGKKTSDGVEIKMFNDPHAYDRIAQRNISKKKIEDMLASSKVSPDKTYPKTRRCYDIPKMRLVVDITTGTIVTVERRRQNK